MSFFNHRNKIIEKMDAQPESESALLSSRNRLNGLNSRNSLKSLNSPNLPTSKGLRQAGKKGFSLIELLIVIVIIAVLGVISFVAIEHTKARAMNERMLDDLVAIANSLEDYRRDHQGDFPVPTAGSNQNVLCFYADATYADCDDGAVKFRQGMIDNDLLGKAYLREVPTDPRTGSRYVYGVSSDKKFYQVAGIWENDDGKFEARTVENLAKGYELPSLIRAYDGPNFVIDREANLPYSSDHLLLTGTMENVNGEVSLDPLGSKSVANGTVVMESNTLYSKPGASADIYFSDGSVTHLDENATLELKSLRTEKNDKTGTVTKILLNLNLGKIWNKVARLAQNSEFRVETSSAIAGVRGTEFGIDSNGAINVWKGTVWTNGKHGEEATALLSPEAAQGATVKTALTSAPSKDDMAANYGTIPLTLENRPHILSIDDGVVTVRNVNYYANRVSALLGLTPSTRKVQVSQLAFYKSEDVLNSSNAAPIGIPSPLSLSNNPDGPYAITFPAGITDALTMRFEYLENGKILASSGFSPIPTTQAGQSMDEKAIYPNLVPLDTGFRLNAPDRVFYPGVPLSVSVSTCPQGARYSIAAADASGANPGICAMAGSDTDCSQAAATDIPVTGTGSCTVTATLRLPDGKTVTDPKTVVVAAPTAQLSVGEPVVRWVQNQDQATNGAGGHWEVSIPWSKGNSTETPSLAVNGSSNTYSCPASTVTGNPVVLPGTCPSLASDKSDDVTYTATFTLGSETPVTKPFTILKEGTAPSADFTLSPAPDATTGMIDTTGDATVNFSVPPIVASDTYTWTGADPTDQTNAKIYVDLSQTPVGQPVTKTVTLTIRDSGKNIVDTKTKTVTVRKIVKISGIAFAAEPIGPSVIASQSTSLGGLDLKIATSDPASAEDQLLVPDCSVGKDNGSLVYTAGKYTYTAPAIADSYSVSCVVKAGTLPAGYVLMTPADQPITFTISVTVPTTSMALASPKANYATNSEIELTLTNLTAAQITVSPTGNGEVTTDRTGKTVFKPTASGTFALSATGVTTISLSVCEYVGDGSKCLTSAQAACYGTDLAPANPPGTGDDTGVWNGTTCDICGNGIVEGAEQCDNGLHCADGTPCSSSTVICNDNSACSLRNIDGCDNTCQIDFGWSCQLITNVPPKTGQHSECAPLCGNGKIDTDIMFGTQKYSENCDNGKQCSTGTQCDNDLTCSLPADGKCLHRSDDGCSDTCQPVSDPDFTCYLNPNHSYTPSIPATLCEPSLLVNCVGKAGIRTDVKPAGNLVGYTSNNSYYQISPPACWVKGGGGQSCDSACSSIGTCDPSYGGQGSWNDDNNCTICKIFNPLAACSSTQSAGAYAPIFNTMVGTNGTCYPRDAINKAKESCNIGSPSMPSYENRMCRCK